MIAVPPQNPTAVTAATLPPANAVAPVEVTVSSTPPNIAQLLRQIQVGGTVAAPADSGTLTLATALGNFSFSLNQLPDHVKQQLIQQLDNLFQSQKQVTAFIQPGSPPSQAIVLLPSIPANPQPSSVQAPLAPPPLTLTPGTTFAAVVLPPDIVIPGSPPAATVPTAAAAATPVTVASANAAPTPATVVPTITAAQTAANQTTPNGGATTGNVTQQAITATGTVAPQEANVTNATPLANAPTATPVASPQTQLLQPGRTVSVEIVSVAPPNVPQPSAGPDEISATVIGKGVNGQLILKAGDATLFVRANVEAPIGTNLLVKLDAPKVPTPAVLPPVDEQNFTLLQQTLDAVAQVNPQLAQQIIETRVPQPNAQLAGPLLFFLSALKQGDMKTWLGKDVADTLALGGKLELLMKLGHTLGSLTQTQNDPTVGEWKSYPFPLQNNGQFQTITMYVHAEGDKAGKGRDGNAASQVRFLIDMRMSKLGAIQLDGLVKSKKLDMIVRSESILPPGLPQELRSSYLSSIEALGYTGGLSFQTGRQHWMVPRKDAPQSFVT